MIDLHCHSNCSDGVLSPNDLLAKAQGLGVTVLALTDHDTVAGLQQLLPLEPPYPMTLIPGIELSVRWKKHDLHILGLNIDISSQHLQALITRQTASRKQRALGIADKMALLGVENAYEKACQIAGHDRLARPHFAQVFLNEGMVSDLKKAFKRFLGRGKPAYVETAWVTMAEAIDVIHQAGGLAVIAHPLKYKLTRSKLHELVTDFKATAGDALEVVSGEMTQSEIQNIAGVSKRFGLLASSGSDYHADGRSRISLGQQRKLPVECTPIWDHWNI